MRHIHIMTALLLAAGSMSAQEATPDVVNDSTVVEAVANTTQFGYFSYSEVIKAMPEYEIAMKSLDELKATYDQELERAEKDFSKKYAEFLEGQKSFPENIMLKRQKELQQLMNQSIQFKNEAKELLAKSEKELLEPIKARLDAAIQSVGYESKFLYILNTDSNAYPFIGADGVNCTERILQKLGE